MDLFNLLKLNLHKHFNSLKIGIKINSFKIKLRITMIKLKVI